MRLLVLLLLLAIVVLQYRLWVGEGSLQEVHRMRQALDVQRAENARLQERNRSLQAEVADLKEGTEAVEERARSELGMVREGETFYQVIEPRVTPETGNE